MDYELMDKIYDTLCKNDGYDQFEPAEFDNMAIVKDEKTGQAIIAMTKDRKEYVLRLIVNEPDEWEVYDYNSGFYENFN